MTRAAERFLWLLPLAALLAGGAACREVPPRRSSAALRELPPGAMPEAIYHPEPLHPANRWRQRAEALRRAAEEARCGLSGAGGGGDPPSPGRAHEPGSAAPPPPAARPLERADRAELIALLERMEQEMADLARDPAPARALHRDLAGDKERLASEGADRDLLGAYDRALRALPAQPPAGPPAREPVRSSGPDL